MNTRRGLTFLLSQQLADLRDGEAHLLVVLGKIRRSSLAHDMRAHIDEVTRSAESFLEFVADAPSLPPTGRGGHSEILRGIARAGERAASEWEASATRDAALLVILRQAVAARTTGLRSSREFAECLRRDDLAPGLLTLEKQAIRLERQLSRLSVGSWFAIGLAQEAAREEADASASDGAFPS